MAKISRCRLAPKVVRQVHGEILENHVLGEGLCTLHERQSAASVFTTWRPQFAERGMLVRRGAHVKREPAGKGIVAARRDGLSIVRVIDEKTLDASAP